MKNVTITKDRYSGSWETVEVDWFYCLECELDEIARGNNYCCNCGAKITWKLEK